VGNATSLPSRSNAAACRISVVIEDVLEGDPLDIEMNVLRIDQTGTILPRQNTLLAGHHKFILSIVPDFRSQFSPLRIPTADIPKFKM
jgi:hypothetical protein